MINSKRFIEHFLQQYRFQMVKSYLVGDVLDFGGNEGELQRFVTGNYTCVNYDHSPMIGMKFDTIVALAIIEHLSVEEVYAVFEKFKGTLNPQGHLFLTTPTKIAKPILDTLAFLHLVDRENIKEHKHYWSQKELVNLATQTGFTIKKYKHFQFGFNQYALLTSL